MKDILVFLGGTMFGGTLAFMVLCLIGGARLKNESKKFADKEKHSDA